MKARMHFFTNGSIYFAIKNARRIINKRPGKGVSILGIAE
jgi:hypothetical protein